MAPEVSVGTKLKFKGKFLSALWCHPNPWHAIPSGGVNLSLAWLQPLGLGHPQLPSSPPSEPPGHLLRAEATLPRSYPWWEK